jgi:hypothetical protein
MGRILRSQRTGRLGTGIVTSGVTSLVGVMMFFLYAAITTPNLFRAPFEKPFIFAIVSMLLAWALGFGVVIGTVGSAVGRWLPSTRWRARLS